MVRIIDIRNKHCIFISMKANELREFIRPMVVEEVQKLLPKLLFEMLSNQSKPVIRESVSNVKTTAPVNRNVETRPQQVSPQKKPMKKFTSNPILNQILNETTPGLPSTQYGAGPSVDLEGAGFSSVGSGISDGFNEEIRQIMNESVTQEIQAEPVESSVPNPLANLFNKDFGAILRKSKEKGLGSANASSIIQNW